MAAKEHSCGAYWRACLWAMKPSPVKIELMRFAMALPAFEGLPLPQGDPQFSSWALCGKGEELSTSDSSTAEVKRSAARDIKRMA